MNKDFPRIITLLREEKGLSQKQAASELGISQPLLSHYEKGIRECSLDFVVKTADYYNVTCDYLLGRTVIRNPYHDIEKTTPDNYDTIQASYTSNNKISPIVNYNKKTIVNSIGILFDLIDSLENIGLLHECCTLFFGTIYGIVLKTDDGSDMKSLAGSVVQTAVREYGRNDDMTALAIKVEVRT